ncbi:MAG: hypothetical protein CL908_17190 [Deltaproteobacteria bacterium]|nr:hypothetical protein [Deltaproteobacteria bacterium]
MNRPSLLHSLLFSLVVSPGCRSNQGQRASGLQRPFAGGESSSSIDRGVFCDSPPRPDDDFPYPNFGLYIARR